MFLPSNEEIAKLGEVMKRNMGTLGVIFDVSTCVM